MKKLISLILILCSFSQIAFAGGCDWSQIKKLPDGGYEYNPTLNLCVGNLVQDDAVKTQQVADLTKAIALKNLAIKYDDERVALWQKSADDELQRLNEIQSNQKHSDFLYFALGVATTFVAAYAASRIYK